jgi:hypothetical protein
MLWSGVVTFVILLIMELVIQGYRHLRGRPEPPFQLVLDRDIILDHEIGEEFLVNEGSGTGSTESGGRRPGAPVDDGLELVEMTGPGEHGVGELDGRDGRLRGPESSTSVSLESRDEV